MPRSPRVDIADAVYHVIARGMERRPIFRTHADRRDLLTRIAQLVPKQDLTLFAYALLDNHFHLVVRRGQLPLAHFMSRLLTGYAGAFNRRHNRLGHLFQNRYKTVLCEQSPYFLQLVRYVHLNPVRARLVSDPALYRWTSHNAYSQWRPATWLDTKTVFEMVGGRGAYRRFIQAAISEGDRADLTGKTVQGNEVESRLWLGGKILGSAQFARTMARASRRQEVEREMQRGQVEELGELAATVARRFGLRVELLSLPGRARAVSAGRRALIMEAVHRRGIRPVDVSRFLRISIASVAEHLRAIERSNS